jgi:hypothetical protein
MKNIKFSLPPMLELSLLCILLGIFPLFSVFTFERAFVVMTKGLSQIIEKPFQLDSPLFWYGIFLTFAFSSISALSMAISIFALRRAIKTIRIKFGDHKDDDALKLTSKLFEVLLLATVFGTFFAPALEVFILEGLR